MSEPPVEFEQNSTNERKRILLQLADSLILKTQNQFTQADIDYDEPFQQSRQIQELAKRIENNQGDVVVLVQLASKLGGNSSIEKFDPNTALMFLGKRRKDKIYGDTWSPLMGKIEPADLEHEYGTLPNIKYGEFLRLIPIVREEREEKSGSQLLAPANVMAQSYLDVETGRIIHVGIKYYPLTPEALSKEWSVAAGGEHTEAKWFNLGSLPTSQMSEGTKKAIKNALVKLAEIQK